MICDGNRLTEVKAQNEVTAVIVEEAASVITSEAEVVSEPDTISEISCEEDLRAWVEEYKQIGGRAKLTADVEINSFYYPMQNAMGGKVPPDLVLDTGEYSLIINAEVYLDSLFSLKIYGQGGTRGLIRVTENGRLYMSFIKVKAASAQDCAVYQEGGILFIAAEDDPSLSVSSKVEILGKVITPEKASALPRDTRYLTPVIVAAGEYPDSADFPQTAVVDILKDGEYLERKAELSIEWELDDIKERMKKSERLLIKGRLIPWHDRYGELLVYGEMECMLYVARLDATFLDFDLTENKGELYGYFSYYLSKVPKSSVLLWSFDGENWVEDASTYIEYGEEDEPGTYESDWIYFEDTLERSFCMKLETEDGINYSNVVRWEDYEIKQKEDREGTRGGGTELEGDELLPDILPEEEEKGKNQPGKDAEGNNNIEGNQNTEGTPNIQGNQNRSAEILPPVLSQRHEMPLFVSWEGSSAEQQGERSPSEQQSGVSQDRDGSETAAVEEAKDTQENSDTQSEAESGSVEAFSERTEAAKEEASMLRKSPVVQIAVGGAVTLAILLAAMTFKMETAVELRRKLRKQLEKFKK